MKPLTIKKDEKQKNKTHRCLEGLDKALSRVEKKQAKFDELLNGFIQTIEKAQNSG